MESQDRLSDYGGQQSQAQAQDDGPMTNYLIMGEDGIYSFREPWNKMLRFVLECRKIRDANGGRGLILLAVEGCNCDKITLPEGGQLPQRGGL